MGCACSIIFTVIGASYGTAKSSGAIFSSGILRPDRLMQNTYAVPDALPLIPPPCTSPYAILLGVNLLTREAR
jgi:hypothetical protein